MSEIKLEDLVRSYIAIRDLRDDLKRKFEEEDGAYKEQMDSLKAELLTICNGLNVSSLKTEDGTVIRKLSERYYSNDWENFSKFVIENNAVDLLERRIHQSNFKHYIADHNIEENGLPPGVNVMREYDISVRRAQ